MKWNISRTSGLAKVFLVCGLLACFNTQSTLAQQTRHWSFQPLTSPKAPILPEGNQPPNPIDAFLLSKQLELGLDPNPRLDKGRLARRAYLDLTGLPPAPEQLEAFLSDASPDAYERLIDNLLSSPRYGERWGRHWLDVARYADSMGYRYDDNTRSSHTYRDFVIRAFNQGLPFNTFIQWQVAGDELAPGNPEALAATGLMAVGPRERDEGTAHNRLETRYNELDDIATTVFSATLGLNMNCARCHDHKYDPISQAEYYQVLKAFMTGERRELPLLTLEHKAELNGWERRLEEVQQRLKDWLEEHRDLFEELPQKPFEDEESLKDSLPGPLFQQWAALVQERRTILEDKPSDPPKGLAYVDVQSNPRPSYLFPRGDLDRPGEEVEFGFLQVLSKNGSKPEPPPPGARTTFQRAALAKWLTDVESGAGHLLARVTINRLWHYHFGEGLVRTLNDFGTQGDAPALPELLDWLSQELIRHEWRLKPMHRLIMTSAVYQQDIVSDEARAAIDPENRYWWRRKPRRLEAEALRDSILEVSGKLNPQMYGPGVFQPVPPELILSRLGQSYPTQIEDGPDLWRRSVYSFVKRTVPSPLTQIFDGPDTSASCGQRMETIVAPQALLLMNDSFVRNRSHDFADRLLRETGPHPEEQVERAFLLALSRPPSEQEMRQSLQFLERQTNSHGGNGRAALADFCQVLFGLNEFIYID